MRRKWIDEVKFDEKGLVPAIIQDARSKELLMVAYMNKEALCMTLEKKNAHFYSRSRKKLWMKGETSGHIQRVKSIAIDCDGDALLVQVVQVGAACHAGYRSCFFRKLTSAKRWKLILRKEFDPDKVYGKKPGR